MTWPYTRPKPPRIASFRYIDYQLAHDTIAVLRVPLKNPWSLETKSDEVARFPTFHEAIMYAQKLAQERKQQHADS